MIQEFNNKSNIYIGIGLLLQIFYRLIFPQLQFHDSLILNLLISWTGVIVFTLGCRYYAKSKGYSGWLGLLGFATLFGLIILFLLPDKTKVPKPLNQN